MIGHMVKIENTLSVRDARTIFNFTPPYGSLSVLIPIIAL